MTDTPAINTLQNIKDLLLTGEYNDALNLCAAHIEENGETLYAIHLLALISYALGNTSRALLLLEKLHEDYPDCREVADSLAVILANSSNLNDSLYYAKLASALESDETHEGLIPPYFRNYAYALENTTNYKTQISPQLEYDKGNFEKSISICKNKVTASPYDWESYALMGQAFREIKSFDDGLTSLKTALSGNPAKIHWQIDIADCYAGLGKFEEAANGYIFAASRLKSYPDELKYLSRIYAALNKIDKASSDESNAVYQRILELTLEDVEESILMGGGEDLEGRRIRIAYLSDEFKDSDKGKIILSILENHDHKKFEIFCYQQNDMSDRTTMKMKTMVDDWREIRDLDDLTAAYLITCDAIDILIDCIGAGADQRLNIVAQKPAPVILSWLNDTDNSGIGTITGTLPSSLSYNAGNLVLSMDFSEKQDLSDDNSNIYGTAVDLENLDFDTINAWCHLLDLDPNANILIGGEGSDQRSVRNRYTEIFMNYGYVKRLFFTNETDMKALLTKADVYLCAGSSSSATNCAMALTTGSPVIALDKSSPLSLTAQNVLKSAGLTDQIAVDAKSYGAKAVQMLNDNKSVDKKSLIEKGMMLPVFQSKEICASFEAALSEAITPFLQN
jgi:predicted O-linked N-acetylglucosamine transferase (SPINDLY family)